MCLLVPYDQVVCVSVLAPPYAYFFFSISSNFRLPTVQMYRDQMKSAFLGEARKLVPTLKDDQVEESFCGVMAQVSTGKVAVRF